MQKIIDHFFTLLEFLVVLCLFAKVKPVHDKNVPTIEVDAVNVVLTWCSTGSRRLAAADVEGSCA